VVIDYCSKQEKKVKLEAEYIKAQEKARAALAEAEQAIHLINT